MSASLTNNEKLSMVNQHIKNCVTNKYNLQLSLISENAVDPKNQETINLLTEQLNKEESKQQALEAEAATLVEAENG